MTTAELTESAKNLVSNEVENKKRTVGFKEVIEFVTLLVLPILTPVFLMLLSK